jgi:hypothetical protein
MKSSKAEDYRAGLYAVAAEACRPLDFPRPAIADAAEELVRRFEAEQRVRLAEFVSKLRALGAPQRTHTAEPTTGTMPSDLIAAAEAGRTARRSKQTIARWCAAHPWEAPGGFAIFIRGRWHVSKAAFAEFLLQRPAR